MPVLLDVQGIAALSKLIVHNGVDMSKRNNILGIIFLAAGLLLPWAACTQTTTKTSNASTNAKPIFRLPPNVIGIAFVDETSPDSFKLRIAFPSELLQPINRTTKRNSTPPFNVKITGSIKLFDKSGPLLNLNKIDNIPVVVYCEDDGGLHYEAELKINIEKSRFLREMKPVVFHESVGGVVTVAAFAIANYDPSKKIRVLSMKTKGKDKLIGALEKNDKAIACFSTHPTEASGATDAWVLETANGTFEMGCSGP